MSASVVCVVGNPNCGKTTLFNALTGGRQSVGNWPGVTVEKKVGAYRHGGEAVTIVDLPGVYSLTPTSSSSEDERVARDYILSGEAGLVLNIVDASNLERNLYLTAQLLEMRVPMVVIVNMMDIAASRHLDIDIDALSKSLDCKVVPMVASRRRGLDDLREVIAQSMGRTTPPAASAPYPPAVSEAVGRIAATLPADSRADRRWTALQLLEGDSTLLRDLPPATALALESDLKQAAQSGTEDFDILIADARYGFVGAIALGAVIRKGQMSRTLTDRIDKVVLHRVLGIPIFLAMMYLMFVFTINVGGAFIDFFDQFAGTLFVDGFGHLLGGAGAPDWLTALLAKGVGGGVQTVATFIPVIGFLYLFLSVLEDSGYMARAAFVMDRFMRGIGLPGKAFVPLIVGFGCNVPAVMATRTMDSRRDRLITVMMAPFMSCGARLPVYVLFAAAFFPSGGQNLVFALYLIGILVAIATGLLLKTTALRGEASPFVMEMPPYHLPTVAGILLRTWDRLKSFILRAGKLVVAVVVVLSFLNSWGTDGSFGNEDTDKSVLAAIGKAIVPVFAPMGISEENWPATVGVFTGIFAKEAVVGTLDALYGTIAEGNAAAAQAEADPEAAATEEPEAFDLWGGLAGAFATIPANLSNVAGALADPLGIEVGDLSDRSAVAADQEISTSSIDAIALLFDGAIGAFAYLLMVLLYMPCVAAVSAIWREVGTRWTLFAAAWTTGMGYGAAVLTYQIGTFSRHPVSSAVDIAVVLAVLAAAIALLRLAGRGSAEAGPISAGQTAS
ncbi:Fe(2+) transporter permease subunit FeoB [Rhodospirillum rubrum]|uniref:Ferrous iron transport protein B n=1 Tax=Rhodospirillum rubrum (strain ATCC 11170 / ATH 1.1.1 / DSM 467 / LMG 4362 / NCIMB 8255 / S1) TaxID=269796 RepID=Q2RRH5_RHORT|nr:Fe(2+) transporter permease subunit FeoB [Rhodospirillum rubrum]ABC23270.1 Ferrous iron transport protein B [Rhodospirillum rubrum ATCC 11170]AEO49002.1 ferrous iron transport protein B [Rhodospirillum rubrum F11]MBK5954940.1 ferrous iron transport protein B [Rhodospirillum rubrum]QXG79245.1 Fe(2+) transporter permease subunit FeoB [Rhodospirillum rubrum]HAP99483.1 Fe(2+) transporter permease subunit FeoB [Rhodospirillum rubrum]